MLSRVVEVMVAGMLCCAAGEAQVLACPGSIATKQEAQTIPAGWTVGRGDVPANLAGVTFYSGLPEERASLMYDSSVKRGGLMYATWRFGVKRTDAIWLSCSYSSTNVVLSRRVSAETAVCTVTYDAKVSVAGSPEVRGIACK